MILKYSACMQDIHVRLMEKVCHDTCIYSMIVLFLHYSIGLQTSGVGDVAIRFRTALIFQPKHANMFLEGFETVLKEY